MTRTRLYVYDSKNCARIFRPSVFLRRNDEKNEKKKRKNERIQTRTKKRRKKRQKRNLHWPSYISSFQNMRSWLLHHRTCHLERKKNNNNETKQTKNYNNPNKKIHTIFFSSTDTHNSKIPLWVFFSQALFTPSLVLVLMHEDTELKKRRHWCITWTHIYIKIYITSYINLVVWLLFSPVVFLHLYFIFFRQKSIFRIEIILYTELIDLLFL